MSVVEEGGDRLARPYTVGTFQTRLNAFQDFLKDVTFQDVEATPEERRQMITESLRFDQFCSFIRSLFGSDVKNSDLKQIYRKISTNPDAKVDWSELFGYFQSSTDNTEEIVVGEDVNIFTVAKRRRVGEAAGDKTRRDTVQCLCYVPSLDTYLSASQKGAICMWSSKLRLQSCIDIDDPSWVTGCDYLPGIRRVICCTERSIVIWDNRSKGKNQSFYSIKPFENSIQCITHVIKPNAAHEDIVLFGDDQGYINVLRIVSKDLNSKLSKNEKKLTSNQPVSHHIDPEKLTNPIIRRKLHHDWVLTIKYFPELRCFASCSPHSKNSFVLEEIERLFDDGDVRSVSIHKGVNCFDYCVKANIIATGGVDKVIRVWHPHIFSRPTGKLIGHLFTIVDICCNEKDQHLISLSTARVFRIWDIHTLTCLQVFTDNEERPGEKRIYSMFFDNRHDRLMTGSSVIDAWPLTRAIQDTMQVPHTHDRPICHVLFNKELNQVATVCTESTIKVWEMETGKKVYNISEAHGQAEVTSLALDSSGYRLASGAYDGSIKLWDFGSGQVLKVRAGRASEEDLSITGMQFCTLAGDRVILVSGWNNKVRLILDTTENYDLPIIREFTDVYYRSREPSLLSGKPETSNLAEPLPSIGQSSKSLKSGNSSAKSLSEPNPKVTSVFKKEYLLMSNEITCMTIHTPNTMISGCANGNIIFWDIEKSAVDKIFRLKPENGSSALRTRQSQDSKINAIAVLVHKERKLDPEYLRKITEEENKDTEAPPEEPTATSKPLPRSTSQLSKQSKMKAAKEEEKKEQSEEVKEKEEKEDKEVVIDGDDKSDSENDSSDEDSVDGRDTVAKHKYDPNKHYITVTYDPIVVTVHQDSFIRFWNMEGTMLREISAITRRQGTPVTALCHDENCNHLITGDQKGYLTLWDVSKFLRSPKSEDQGTIKQMLCWRSHLMKVVSLTYVDALRCTISGSTDGSVRLWWGTKGRFVGFFSQHRSFIWPDADSPGAEILPYDITEAPLAPIRKKGAGGPQKSRSVEMYEYPLVFDNDRWQPYKKRSAQAKQPPDLIKSSLEKKFFGALIKPKAYNHHLESFTPGDRKKGAVYRALPVYRIRTPERMKTPEAAFHIPVDDKSNGAQNSKNKKDPTQNNSNMAARRMSRKSSDGPNMLKQISKMNTSSTAVTQSAPGPLLSSPRRR